MAELWLYPDGSPLFELSTKCRAGRGAPRCPRSARTCEREGVDLGGDQQTKTKSALEFFAGELAQQA